MLQSICFKNSLSDFVLALARVSNKECLRAILVFRRFSWNALKFWVFGSSVTLENFVLLLMSKNWLVYFTLRYCNHDWSVISMSVPIIISLYSWGIASYTWRWWMADDHEWVQVVKLIKMVLVIHCWIMRYEHKSSCLGVMILVNEVHRRKYWIFEEHVLLKLITCFIL